MTESDGPPLVSSVIELRHSYGRLLHLKQEIVSTEGWAYSAAAVTLLYQRFLTLFSENVRAALLYYHSLLLLV